MTERIFLPVGGTDGGATAKPFKVELWKYIFSNIKNENPKVGLLITPSKLTNGLIDCELLLNNYKDLQKELNCTFDILEEETFSEGKYDSQYDILCITCGNTQGARDLWSSLNCENKIKEWYQKGILVTGYSAGFILFFEWASTDSVKGPDGVEFGMMQGMGIIKGAAIPHIDTQKDRINNFQKVLSRKEIEPALALGEDVMADFRDEELIKIISPLEKPMAFLVKKDKLITIPIISLDI